MLVAAIGARLSACTQPVVDVPPVVRRYLCRLDAERFDGIDAVKHALDHRPAVELEQQFTAWPDDGMRLERLGSPDGTQDVDAREDRAVVVRGPANEGKDAARREADQAAVTVEDSEYEARVAKKPGADGGGIQGGSNFPRA